MQDAVSEWRDGLLGRSHLVEAKQILLAACEPQDLAMRPRIRELPPDRWVGHDHEQSEGRPLERHLTGQVRQLPLELLSKALGDVLELPEWARVALPGSEDPAILVAA